MRSEKDKMLEIPRELLHEVRPKVQVSRGASLGAQRNLGHSVIEAPAIKLGANVVVDYEGNGAHARVQVQFDEVGAKWLVMAYANLTVI